MSMYKHLSTGRRPACLLLALCIININSAAALLSPGQIMLHGAVHGSCPCTTLKQRLTSRCTACCQRPLTAVDLLSAGVHLLRSWLAASRFRQRL